MDEGVRGPSFQLFLPQMRMSHEAIVERARTAEGAGFEGISFMDHLAPPMASDQDLWEAMHIAGWVLAHTATLQAGHLVLCDAMRHPSVLARQATSLDHASGGRFELGIGWGSVPEELATFGVGSTEARVRVARLAESLEIMRALWTGEVVDHAGVHFTLVGAQQRPVPTRPIPITIGGVGPQTLALVRRHADWWNVPVHELHRLDELREQVGDTRVSIQPRVALLADESERDEVTATLRRRFGDTVMGTRAVIGTVDQVSEHFHAEHQRGIERFCVWFTDFAPVSTLERFGEVIAALRS